MKCPVDKSPLIIVERAGIELDYCLECKGIWFDSGELELFVESLIDSVTLPDIASLPELAIDEAPRVSPRSGKKMEKINMGSEEHPVIIDRDKHGLGLWFDGGELSEVIARFTSSGKTGGAEIIKFLGETFRF